MSMLRRSYATAANPATDSGESGLAGLRPPRQDHGNTDLWRSSVKIRDMRGLGPASEEQLRQIGINTPDELRAAGSIQAFVRLNEHFGAKQSLNFLYALVGALEDRDWRDVAKNDRGRLLLALEDLQELQKLFESE